MDFIAFDFETTGISHERDQIIEIGAVKFINNIPVAEFGCLINPQTAIPYGATRVNGISDDMVADAPLIEDKLDALAEFCEELPMIAHNAPFDYKFLKAAVEKHQSTAPKGPVLDSCQLARKTLHGMFNYKLITLADYFNIRCENFHRATDDAKCCGELFIHLLEVMHKMGESVSVADIARISGKKELFFPQPPKENQLSLF